MPTADTLRTLAATGMTRAAMAVHLDITITVLDRILRAHDIRTNGKRGVPAKPIDDSPLIGGFGQKPAKLMPSSRALGLVSIFSMGL